MAKKKSASREILELILAFIGAWAIYQLLTLATGTALPVVSIVSDSMYHGPNINGLMCGMRVEDEHNFGRFWDSCGGDYEQFGITKEQFATFLAPSGMSRGDLLIAVRDDNPKVGDVLIYQREGSRFTIVHRLVEAGDDYYITKGDNNKIADPPITKQSVVGRVAFAIPVLGYPRLLLHMIGI